jgi:hypothetical protein
MSYVRSLSWAALMAWAALLASCSPQSGTESSHAATSKSPAAPPSAAVESSPSKSALPPGAIVVPRDDPYGDLISGDTEELVSADDRTWVRLSDEAGRHMTEARAAFEQSDRGRATVELQRAAAQLILESTRATPPVSKGLRSSAVELDNLARGIRDGKVVSIHDLDAALAQAASILAKHYSERAFIALKENHPRNAGHFLKSAANYLQKLKWDAEYFQDAQVRQAMEDLGHDTLLVSEKLIAGTGYTADEASKAVEKVSHAVLKYGEHVAGQHDAAKPTVNAKD